MLRTGSTHGSAGLEGRDACSGKKEAAPSAAVATSKCIPSASTNATAWRGPSGMRAINSSRTGRASEGCQFFGIQAANALPSLLAK